MSLLVARLRRTPPLRALVGLIALVVFGAVNIAIGWVIVSGRLDGHWYDIRDLGYAVARLRTLLDDHMDHRVSYLVTALIGALGILSVVGGALLILPWVERRLLARFQVRRGPNRVGPFGLFQSVADALKLMQKEIVIPRGADLFMYVLPPVFVFVPSILVWGPVPWAPRMSYIDLDIGVVFLIAVTSLNTLAVFIAGWSSANHYATLGAMRSVAMMVSYEIPLSLSLLAVVLLTSSTRLSTIAMWQADHHVWLGMLLPLALFTFLFSSTAELNRSPNDIAEAESEIVAGYFTEYSGMKAGLFMAVELGNALAVGALVSTFFLGGWSLFGLEQWIPPYLIFLGKLSVMYFIFVWTRASMPRIRLDQLMTFAWKYLIPLSMAQTLLVAIEAMVLHRWDVPGIVALGLIGVVNIGCTVIAVRKWAQFLGYRPVPLSDREPTLVTAMGGLRAAARVHAAVPGSEPRS